MSQSDRPPKTTEEIYRDFKKLVGALTQLHTANEAAIEKLNNKLDSKNENLKAEIAELRGELKGIIRSIQALEDSAGDMGKDLAVLETTGKIRIQKPEENKPGEKKPEESPLENAQAKALRWGPIATSALAVILTILNNCGVVHVQNTDNNTTVTIPNTSMRE